MIIAHLPAMDFFNNLRGICNESISSSENDNENDIKVEQASDDKPAEGYDEFLKFLNPHADC